MSDTINDNLKAMQHTLLLLKTALEQQQQTHLDDAALKNLQSIAEVVTAIIHDATNRMDDNT